MRPKPPSREDAVVVGKITGVWGLQGDLKVESYTDSDRRFSPGGLVYLDGRPGRVLQARKHRSGFVVRLDLVSDRAQAESLRGKPLTVPANDLEPLPAGSYYYFQLIGIAVRTEDGVYLGEVKEILATGSNDVYVVRDAGKEVLLPALETVILDVDLGAGTMTVRVPEGLM
jgi:16S rRNA processing protein RimM